MTLVEATNQFALRLYQWSLKDFVRELDEGCPLLSMVGLHGRFITAFVQWVQTMPREDRIHLTSCLIRRSHELAVALRGETITAEEKRAFNEWFAREVNIRCHELPPLPSEVSEWPSNREVNPKECMNCLFGLLPPILGAAKQSKLRVQAIRQMGDWRLMTEFIFFKTEHLLSCEYQFVRSDGHRIIGHFNGYPRNLFMFYGLANTTVRVPTQADVEPMVKVMSKLAEHFVCQAEPLFAGLGVND